MDILLLAFILVSATQHQSRQIAEAATFGPLLSHGEFSDDRNHCHLNRTLWCMFMINCGKYTGRLSIVSAILSEDYNKY